MEKVAGVRKVNTGALFAAIGRARERMEERRFAFVLGAGASVTSGIPVGRTLALRWLTELWADDAAENKPPLEKWATVESLDIEGFDFEQLSEFYPQIYDRRFEGDPEDGQSDLESVMTGDQVSPSIGYAILAQILAKGEHSVVVTTNFDHLVSDALTQFTTKEPVVVGHEGLASLVRPNLTRPLIVKIHRDLFYDPHSSPEKVNRLHEKWVGPLKQLLQFYSPIVIGYGGNDGSLMGLLEELSANEIAGRIHWCYREADGPPGKRILRVLKKTHGVLVPIIGFDELMLQLAQEMGVPLVDQQLDEVARVRGARLKTELEGIRTRLLGSEASESDTVLNALEKGLERQLERQDDWWAWSLKAKACSDPEERVNVYSTAVERLPRSAELRMGLALALLARGNRQEAEDAAMQAYGLDRRLALDFARVHARVSNDPNVVRAAFDAALDQAPEDASASAEYAEWLGARGDAQAVLMFETALDLDPKHVFGLARYAQFLYRSSRYEEARGFAQRAWASLAPRPEQLAAEMAFLLAVLATRREEDPKSALARVKAILEDGMRQVDLPRLVGQPRWWSSMHDPSLTKLAKWLDLWGPTKSSFAGDATWQELEPIPADEPWPEENFRV